jgi:hypothetical protein
MRLNWHRFPRAAVLAAASAVALLAPGSLAAQLAPPSATLDEEFTRIRSVRELRDGRVLVSDDQEKRVVIADLASGAVRLVGRTGRGPGEYEQPGLLFPTRGDSTLMQDAGNPRRWLFFAGDSIVFALPPDHPTILATAGSVGGSDSRGFLLARRGGALVDAGEGIRQMTSTLLRVELSSGRADTIGSALGVRFRTTGPAAAGNPVQFAPTEPSVIFPDGWVAVLRRDPYRVDWLPPEGPSRPGAEISIERVRVTEEEKQFWHDQVLADAGTDRAFDYSSTPFAEFIAPYRAGGATAIPDGSLLVFRERSRAAPGNDYDIIDRSGRRVRAIHLPRNERIVGFGAASVYVSVRDDDGIERLRRHPWAAARR